MNIKIPLLKNSKIPLFQIMLGCGVVTCLFLTAPQIVLLGRTSREISEKKMILGTLDGGIKNFAALEKELEDLNDAYADFVNRLPPQKEFPVFLELLSEMAKKNNVKIVAIEPQKLIDDPTLFFVTIPVFLDAYCGYHDLGKFISALENAEKFMRIDNIKISGDDTGSGNHQIFLAIHTFCLREMPDETGIQ